MNSNTKTKKSLRSLQAASQGRAASIEIATPSSISASLFYELARLVAWGARNEHVVTVHPELGRLLESSAAALTKGGIPEGPAECLAA